MRALRFTVFVFFCMQAWAQTVSVRPASPLAFPSPVDSNSPAQWRNGRLELYLSTAYNPMLAQGTDVSNLGNPTPVEASNSEHVPFWIESTYVESADTVLAWYHHEPRGVCGPDSRLTAPEIGAMVSHDGGHSFSDLGIVLSSGDEIDCSSLNQYFAGGHGDFTVILSEDKDYFYFLFSNYGGDLASQGVAIARLPFDRRLNPVGAVQKYYQGGWDEPGLGGRLSPILPAAASWDGFEVDAFWGPSIHWNTALGCYVLLLNHAVSPNWDQDGVYAALLPDLSDPTGIQTPFEILDGSAGWYPQVIGYGPDGTDRRAGDTARLFVSGISNWEIVFKP